MLTDASIFSVILFSPHACSTQRKLSRALLPPGTPIVAMHVANRSSKPSQRVSGGSTHALGSGFDGAVDATGARGRRGGTRDSAGTAVSIVVVPEKAETTLAELHGVRQ